MWDYIVVGGGIAGSVISSRLIEQDRTLKILMIEAGPDVSSRTDITYVNSTNLIMGDFDYNDQTVPQLNMNNRQIGNAGGRALGGGSVINTGGWTRGDKVDYDLWAETVGDQRWSYDSQLQYFRKTEDWCDPKQHPDQHGMGGPQHVASISSTGREYPLRNKVLESWREIGVDALPELDGNAGRIQGVSELYENRREGKRQISSSVYPLDGVTVLTETIVESVMLSKDGSDVRATGVRIANGTEYAAKRVIMTAGAYRTPQLLMLSGIGPGETLAKHGIEPKFEMPDVGKHLADHVMYYMFWKLKDPALGYALGSSNPLFSEQQFGLGNPTDFITSTSIQQDEVLARAIAKDKEDQAAEGEVFKSDFQQHPLYMENFILYVPFPSADPVVPVDGTHITTTMVDRHVWRTALRQMAKLVASDSTVLGREVIASETPPSAFAARPLSSARDVLEDDAYLDARVAAGANSTYHGHGTCAMGKVVEPSSLRVCGVQGLYVADASVIPVVLGSHIQAAVYALAEQAAVLIAQDQ
ncbi:GMC oxidoreductase [Apiospora kogelbergensis]|uniref:GMC oxidoreductase n=1 Tax=Apiospora kogelbergensis TaxID=1337665 RepID=A0AAW0R6W4_9PEZI